MALTRPTGWAVPTILITGATGGLGQAVAVGLARAAANVMLTARSEDKLASIASSIMIEGGSVAYAIARPDDAEDMRRVVEATAERYGGLDVLITAAGTNHVHPIIEYPLEEWEEVMDVNVKGTWLVCKEAGRVMIEQGRGGKVILISSARGERGMANYSGYSPSKSRGRERILGTHWWNPPYLVPLVEIVRTEDTAQHCVGAIYDLLLRVGKSPVRVHKDVPGFVGNRLQHALWREAFALIDDGICDAATVDEVVRSGFGLRLPVLGPVENADLTAALTGAITVPTQTRYLPYTPEAIAADAIACAKAGATAVHIHVRDPQDGHPTSDLELFGEVVKLIKGESNVIVGLTTGGGMGMTPQERLRVVPRYQPELASCNLGSINFSMHPVARRYKPEDYRFDWEQAYVEGTKDFIFRNTFGDMEVFAETMQAHNTRSEYEAYDVGHLYNLRFLERSGIVKAPHWIQFVLGVLGALAATPEDLLVMKATADRLFGPENYRWSVIGVGYPAEFNMAAMAIMMGGHVRVGLEDNIYVQRGVLATNAQLVEKVMRLANEFEREIATPDEARALLGLKGYNAVNY